MIISRKGIGSIVAMGMLILVAVISSIYFNLFNINYTTDFLEDNSNREDILGQELVIDKLYGNVLYVTSEFDTVIDIQEVALDGNSCKVNGTYSKGVSQLNLNESCVTPAGDFPQVKIITDRGVFERTVFFSNVSVVALAPGGSGGSSNNTAWTSNSNICNALTSYYPMNQTVRPHVEDNFDDNSYNTSIWTEESDASSNMAETGGEIYFDSSGGGSDESAWLNASERPITGNWDMYARWRVITQSNPSTGYHLGFLTMDGSGGANEIRVGRIRLAAGNQRYAIYDESYSSINQYTEANTAGWVRSTRTNTTNTTFLEWNSAISLFEWAGSYEGYSHGDLMSGVYWPAIQFHMEAGGEWDFAFDDFVLWNDSYIANDFSSNNNNALAHAWSSANGKFGGAYEFDGVGAKLLVNHSSDYIETNTGTVAAWFYANSSIYPRYIISKDSSGFDDGGHFGIFIDDATGPDKLTARFQDSAASYTLESTNFSMNTWQHVAFTWDGSNTRLYLNGYEQNSTASNWNWTPNLNPISIGTGLATSLDNSYWAPQYYFNGSIDDVAIWNTSLTAEQIAFIYNSATDDISALCRP